MKNIIILIAVISIIGCNDGSGRMAGNSKIEKLLPNSTYATTNVFYNFFWAQSYVEIEFEANGAHYNALINYESAEEIKAADLMKLIRSNTAYTMQKKKK